MRVAYVISTLDRCGPVNVLFDIINNLGDDIETRIFTLAKEPATSRLRDFELIGCKVMRVCNSRMESILLGSALLKRGLDSYSPDIVHAHGFRPYLFCQSLRYPTVATVHNCLYDDFVRTYGRRQASWMTKRELTALKTFNEIVACSKSNAAYLESNYGLRCLSIRNGVDQDRFKPVDAAGRLALRRKFGIRPESTVLISTGGCSELKGTIPLIQGFNRALDDKHGNVELHIFGEGPIFDICHQYQSDHVMLHGFQSDIVPWLQTADLFVSASCSEGMPLAVLEALSCGCRVLLSDIAPHREVVSALHDEECTFFFSSLDEGTIALDIERALDAPSKRVDTCSCFGAATMSASYRNLYFDCVDKGVEA